MNYQSLLKKYLDDKQNRKYSATILEKLTGQHRHGFIAEIRREGAFVDRIQETIDFLVEDAVAKKRYTASVLPTIVSPDQAPNFWFINEKEPTAEEVYRLLYLLLTGLYRGNYVVNLDNVGIRIMEEFRDSLIKRAILLQEATTGGIDIGKILAELQIRKFSLAEFGFSLLTLSYFVSWVRDKTKLYPEWIQKVQKIGLPSTLSEIGIEDTCSLVTCKIHKQKKEMYITPRVKDFVVKWYDDFLYGKADSPYLLSFLSSLYVSHKNYRRISDPMANKFIYYLLRGYVNGELLTDMINLKMKYELKEKRGRPFPILKVHEFMKKID